VKSPQSRWLAFFLLEKRPKEALASKIKMLPAGRGLVTESGNQLLKMILNFILTLLPFGEWLLRDQNPLFFVNS